MNWNKLLAAGDVQRHKTTRQEIEALRAVIRRDLTDAQLEGLSDDRRFATAYNAALQCAVMAIACAGYRVSGKVGHHKTTLGAARLALGPVAVAFTDYFETCRRKRNVIDYDRAHVATPTETEEVLEKASEFCDFVEAWIVKNHAALKA